MKKLKLTFLISLVALQVLEIFLKNVDVVSPDTLSVVMAWLDALIILSALGLMVVIFKEMKASKNPK